MPELQAELSYMLNAKITKKTGNRVSDSIHFEAECHKEITEDRAKEAQTKLGYIPAGYSFYDFEVKKDPVLLRYKATWKCQACCN